MPSTGAYLIGGLIAAEATGVTNFSGGGGSSGGGSAAPKAPDLSGIRQAIMMGQMQQSNTIQDLKDQIARTQNMAQGSTGVDPNLMAMMAMQNKGGGNQGPSSEDVRGWIEAAVESVPMPEGPDPTTPPPEDGGGHSGPSQTRLMDKYMQVQQKQADIMRQNVNTERIAKYGPNKRYDLQDSPNPIVRNIGEGGKAAGQTVQAVSDFVGTPGPKAKTSGGVFGGIYDAGQATGEAARETKDFLTRDPTKSLPFTL